MKLEEKVKKIVEELRLNFNLEVYPKIVEKMCNECDVRCFILSSEYDLGYEQIHLTNLGMYEPFHRASLLGQMEEGIPTWYLVDVTYGQFFEEKHFKNYMFENHKEFSEKLLNNGYIECSTVNMLAYIDGFLYSKKYYKYNKDKIETVCKNVTDLLEKIQVSVVEKDKLYERLLDILLNRKDLLEMKENEITDEFKLNI